MHFFYLDEAGCNGNDLNNSEQPIFILGGIIVRDEGWNKTKEAYEMIFSNYFNNNIPDNFELHSDELFSPNGDGPFEGHSRTDRNNLINTLLDLIISRNHQIAYCAIEKSSLAAADNTTISIENYFNTKTPYLLAYDYLISLYEKHIRGKLGRSARGMIIIDIKDEFSNEISVVTNHRRYRVPKNQRIVRLTEFTYSVDSKKNPMIQLSDLICYITKKYLEIDKGYRENYTSELKTIFRDFYNKIHGRIIRSSLVNFKGKQFIFYNEYLKQVIVFPKRRFASTNYEIVE